MVNYGLTKPELAGICRKFLFEDTVELLNRNINRNYSLAVRSYMQNHSLGMKEMCDNLNLVGNYLNNLRNS